MHQTKWMSPRQKMRRKIKQQNIHGRWEIIRCAICLKENALPTSRAPQIVPSCPLPLSWIKLGVARVAENVGLPPRLTSFRIISSQSAFSEKKKCLWYKNTIIALVGKIFLPFPLSVSTSSHPICHYCPGSGLESIFGNNVCSRYILRTLCVFLPGQYMHNEDCPGALHTILIRFSFSSSSSPFE